MTVKLRKCGYRSNLCYFFVSITYIDWKISFHLEEKKSPPKFNLYLKRVIRKKKLLLGDNVFFPKYAFIQVAKTLLKHFKIGK